MQVEHSQSVSMLQEFSPERLERSPISDNLQPVQASFGGENDDDAFEE